MQYQDFIETFRQAAHGGIKTISLPESCCPRQIPNSFKLLFPNLIHILLENMSYLCSQSQIIAIFGLQVVSQVLQSHLPHQAERIYHHTQPNFHLCCSLNYLKLKAAHISPDVNWQNYHSLIVDFTSGQVMNRRHYLFLLFNQGRRGKVFGQLDQPLLKSIWAKVNLLSREQL